MKAIVPAPPTAMRQHNPTAIFIAAFLVCVGWALTVFAQEKDASPARVLDDVEMFMIGADANRLDVILHLLKKGIDPNVRGKKGATAMIVAAGKGNLNVIELLLVRGGDVNAAGDEGWTALMEAAYREKATMVKRLLRAGADVEARERRYGLSALMVAAKTDEPEIVTALIAKGAGLNHAGVKRGLTALHFALANTGLKSVEIVSELLVAGAKPGTPAKDGFTPLMAAVESGLVDKLSLIVSENVEVNAVTEDGRTAIGRAADNGSAEMVRRLLAAGAVATAPQGRMTPLSAAVRAGSVEAARLLIDAGANPDRPDKGGKTPLILAVLGAHDALLELLLERGAAPDGRNSKDGTTALMWAANTGRKSFVKLLMERGANAALAAQDGWTAGEAARMAGHDDIARMLEQKI